MFWIVGCRSFRKIEACSSRFSFSPQDWTFSQRIFTSNNSPGWKLPMIHFSNFFWSFPLNIPLFPSIFQSRSQKGSLFRVLHLTGRKRRIIIFHFDTIIATFLIQSQWFFTFFNLPALSERNRERILRLTRTSSSSSTNVETKPPPASQFLMWNGPTSIFGRDGNMRADKWSHSDGGVMSNNYCKFGGENCRVFRTICSFVYEGENISTT